MSWVVQEYHRLTTPQTEVDLVACTGWVLLFVDSTKNAVSYQLLVRPVFDWLVNTGWLELWLQVTESPCTCRFFIIDILIFRFVPTQSVENWSFRLLSTGSIKQTSLLFKLWFYFLTNGFLDRYGRMNTQGIYLRKVPSHPMKSNPNMDTY